ncbi:MAG: hypothetical protein ACRD2U_10605 [Terriglobales bacterium]
MKRLIVAIAALLFSTMLSVPLSGQDAGADQSARLVLVKHKVKRHHAHKHGKHKAPKHSKRA